MSRVEGKVERCRKNLKWWSKVAFGNVIRSLREKKDLLKVAKEEAISGGSISWVQRLKKEISNLLVREEQMRNFGTLFAKRETPNSFGPGCLLQLAI